VLTFGPLFQYLQSSAFFPCFQLALTASCSFRLPWSRVLLSSLGGSGSLNSLILAGLVRDLLTSPIFWPDCLLLCSPATFCRLAPSMGGGLLSFLFAFLASCPFSCSFFPILARRTFDPNYDLSRFLKRGAFRPRLPMHCRSLVALCWLRLFRWFFFKGPDFPINL